MQLATRTFDVEGVPFTVSFGKEGAHVVATLQASDPDYEVLSDCLTAAWKLFPVELIESLCDHRMVIVGEFYRITYGDDPDHGHGGNCVNIFDGETELDTYASFFSAVAIAMAKSHLAVVGEGHFPWFARLTPAAKAKIA